MALVLGPVITLHEGIEVMPFVVVVDFDRRVAGPAHVAAFPADGLVKRLQNRVLAAAEAPAVAVDHFQRPYRLRRSLCRISPVEDRVVEVAIEGDGLLVVGLRAR